MKFGDSAWLINWNVFIRLIFQDLSLFIVQCRNMAKSKVSMHPLPIIKSGEVKAKMLSNCVLVNLEMRTYRKAMQFIL